MEIFKIWAVVLGMSVIVGAQTASAQDSEQQQNAAKEIRSLHWVEGPTQVSVGLNATFKIPAGYRFLGPADTIQFMRIGQN